MGQYRDGTGRSTGSPVGRRERWGRWESQSTRSCSLRVGVECPVLSITTLIRIITRAPQYVQISIDRRFDTGLVGEANESGGRRAKRGFLTDPDVAGPREAKPSGGNVRKSRRDFRSASATRGVSEDDGRLTLSTAGRARRVRGAIFPQVLARPSPPKERGAEGGF